MLKTILLVLSSCFLLASAIAESNLKGLKVLDAKAPSELKLLVEHIQARVQDSAIALEAINYARIINEDLASQDATLSLYLIKTEIYRNILKSVHLEQKSKIEVNSSLIKSVENRIQKADYSSFSKWLIGSILDDLNYYNSNGLLDNRDKIARFNAKDNLLVLELEKKLKFLGPWLETIEKVPTSKFEEIMTKTALSTLKSIATKSFYYGNFAATHAPQDKSNIFELPNVEIDKSSTTPTSPTSVKEQAQMNKTRAQETVKGINPEDLSEASKEIDKITVPKKENWVPK